MASFPFVEMVRQLVVHEVHRPSLVWTRRDLAVVPQLRLDLPLWRLVTELQGHLAADLPDAPDQPIPKFPCTRLLTRHLLRQGRGHTRGKPHHPKTQGRMERWRQTLGPAHPARELLSAW